MQADGSRVHYTSLHPNKEDGCLEVVVVFGPKKANGYRSNNPNLNPEVNMQDEELYSKFYPTNEKITNNEFGQKLYWGIMAKQKDVPVNWASLGLEVAREKARRGLKGPQIIEAHTIIVDKDVVVTLEGVIVGSLSMHKPKETPHGLTMVINHGRRPICFTKEVSRIKELQELKKGGVSSFEIIHSKFFQQKSNLETKVKHLCSQMEDKEAAYANVKMKMEIAMGKFSAQRTHVENLQVVLMGMSNEDKGWKGCKLLLNYSLISKMALVMRWIIIPKLSKDWTSVPGLEFLHTTIHVKKLKILILTLLRLNKNLLQFKLLWSPSKTK